MGSLLVLDCTGQREIRGQAVRLRQAHEWDFLRAARGRAALLIVRLAWHRVGRCWLQRFFESDFQGSLRIPHAMSTEALELDSVVQGHNLSTRMLW